MLDQTYKIYKTIRNLIKELDDLDLHFPDRQLIEAFKTNCARLDTIFPAFINRWKNENDTQQSDNKINCALDSSE